ncbi:u3 small nucleolar RNA-associated protein 11 [Hygrophoropsis aurantiaca]|uniref:U3 small nucleolar RNA-associated protein 11 n=1 Tax=Hygrophoropsis aurantiaca TaxID=72124 RepID=A0ACB8AP13_9AGAM|nr:u3 small nucleolar RNA-associated protein 11 [Hygrophoropsis aurantiaca]
MTSSLRNSLHRRNHKERSQLAHRSRFGILEKHKDYVLRARDYHSKQDRITRLKQKAADRNKDEFYFGMNKERTVQGVHVKDRGNVSMPADLVKILKTQDEGYVRTMRSVGRKKIDNLKRDLTMMANLVISNPKTPDDGEDTLEPSELKTLQEAGIIPPSQGKRKCGRARPKHIIYVDNGEDGQPHSQSNDEVKKGEDSTGSHEERKLDLGWKTAEKKKLPKNKGTVSARIVNEAEEEEDTTSIAQLHRKKLLKELAARLTRDTRLTYAQRELEMQRLLTGKGRRRKLTGVEEIKGDGDDNDDEDEDESHRRRSKPDDKLHKPRVYKWRIERKR